jgi:hypothetical protein
VWETTEQIRGKNKREDCGRELEVHKLAIILIGVVVNVSGIVFCMADNLIAVGVASAVSTLVGLTLVGCMTPENRWRNIILVAAGVWVTDLLPAAIGTISLSFSGWVGSIVWYAILSPRRKSTI